MVTLIKAASKSTVAAIAAYQFWLTLGAAGVCPWLERVPTELNVADRPSREPQDYTICPFPALQDPVQRT